MAYGNISCESWSVECGESVKQFNWTTVAALLPKTGCTKRFVPHFLIISSSHLYTIMWLHVQHYIIYNTLVSTCSLHLIVELFIKTCLLGLQTTQTLIRIDGIQYVLFGHSYIVHANFAAVFQWGKIAAICCMYLALQCVIAKTHPFPTS